MFRIYCVLLSFVCSQGIYAADGTPDELESDRRAREFVRGHRETSRAVCDDIFDRLTREIGASRERIGALVALPDGLPEERARRNEALQREVSRMQSLEERIIEGRTRLGGINEGCCQAMPVLVADARWEGERRGQEARGKHEARLIEDLTRGYEARLEAVREEARREVEAILESTRRDREMREEAERREQATRWEQEARLVEEIARECRERAEAERGREEALGVIACLRREHEARGEAERREQTARGEQEARLVEEIRRECQERGEAERRRECHEQQRPAGDSGASAASSTPASSTITIPDAPPEVAPDMCSYLERRRRLEKEEETKRAPAPVDAGDFHLTFRVVDKKEDGDRPLVIKLSDDDYRALVLFTYSEFWSLEETLLRRNLDMLTASVSYLLKSTGRYFLSRNIGIASRPSLQSHLSLMLSKHSSFSL